MSSTIPIRVREVIASKYRLERQLGKGGMGVVFAARHVKLGSMVALKFMLPAAVLGGSDDTVGAEEATLLVERKARFLREARAAANLKGEHVARVHDVAELEDGTPYMVQELLEGHDLSQVLELCGGQVPQAEAIEYVRQACEGVKEAHAAGTIHRDLKPANLFLTRRPNGTPLVKVLDFGISKIAGADGHPQEMIMTSSGQLLGSPHYMSPEHLRGATTVEFRSDVYAFGVILYELLSGRRPFESNSFGQHCDHVFTKPAPPLRTFAPGVSAELETVVMKCLEREIDDRFESVGALQAALARVAGATTGGSASVLPPHLPALTPPPTPGSSDRPMASSTLGRAVSSASARPRRTGKWLGSGPMLVGIVLAAGVAAVVSATRGRDAKVSTAPEPPPSVVSTDALSARAEVSVAPSAAPSIAPPASDRAAAMRERPSSSAVSQLPLHPKETNVRPPPWSLPSSSSPAAAQPPKSSPRPSSTAYSSRQ